MSYDRTNKQTDRQTLQQRLQFYNVIKISTFALSIKWDQNLTI